MPTGTSYIHKHGQRGAPTLISGFGVLQLARTRSRLATVREGSELLIHHRAVRFNQTRYDSQLRYGPRYAASTRSMVTTQGRSCHRRGQWMADGLEPCCACSTSAHAPCGSQKRRPCGDKMAPQLLPSTTTMINKPSHHKVLVSGCRLHDNTHRNAAHIPVICLHNTACDISVGNST